MNLTIRQKILAVFFLLTLIIIIAMSGAYYYFFTQDMRARSEKQIWIVFDMLFG
jgi:CHASE3 domain sensor protein